MSIKILLFLLVCAQYLVHVKSWYMFRRRPVVYYPPRNYYGYHPTNGRTITHGDHHHQIQQQAKSPGSKEVQFDPDPMFNPGMYQGDIIGPLPDEVTPFVMANFIWKNGIIPYEINPELESRRIEITSAMADITGKTCIRFKPKEASDVDYVHIYAGPGCSSSVGRRGGRQTLSLGRGCYSNGIIVHELMHAIGFYHLHQRYDRDDYLNIHWTNIQPTAIQNFKKMAPDDLRVDAVFDYASVMLYGDTTFSIDKVSKTMTPTIDGIELRPPAAKGSLSEVDVMSINRLYGCGGPLPYIYGNRI